MAAALAEALQQLSCGAGSDGEHEEGDERVWGEAEAGCSAAPDGNGHAAAGLVNAQGACGLHKGFLLVPYGRPSSLCLSWPKGERFRMVRAWTWSSAG